MASERIGDMTKAELEAFIIQIVEKHFPHLGRVQQSDRSPMEVFESMQKNLLEKKPGQPSVTDMIREDKDQ